MNGTWGGRGDHLQDGDRHHLLCPERAVAPGGPDGDPAAASCVLPNPWQSCFAWVCCCHPHHGATSRGTGIPKVTSDMTPKTTPTAGEPACAETARAGVHMLLPTAPAHSPLTPLSWGWARGPWRRGSHSRWVAEVGERLQGSAWGCALRAASSALPTTRHCLDFFLC